MRGLELLRSGERALVGVLPRVMFALLPRGEDPWAIAAFEDLLRLEGARSFFTRGGQSTALFAEALAIDTLSDDWILICKHNEAARGADCGPEVVWQ